MKSLVSLFLFFLFFTCNYTFAQKTFWSINAFVPISFGYQPHLKVQDLSSGFALDKGVSLAYAQKVGKYHFIQEDFGIQSKSFALTKVYPGFNFYSRLQVKYNSIFLGFTYSYAIRPAIFLVSGLILSRTEHIGYSYTGNTGGNNNLGWTDFHGEPVWMPEIKAGGSIGIGKRINTGIFFQAGLKKAPLAVLRDVTNMSAHINIEPYLSHIALNINYKLTGTKQK